MLSERTDEDEELVSFDCGFPFHFRRNYASYTSSKVILDESDSRKETANLTEQVVCTSQ